MSYIIYDQTQAIVPIESNIFRSKVYETNRVFEVEEDPITIIKNSCEYYGYTLSIWNEFIGNKLSSKTKLPVPILPSEGLFFLPTSSHNNPHCIWLSYYKIAGFTEYNHLKNIVLKDGQIIPTDVSINQLNLQRKRMGIVIAYYFQLYCMSKKVSN